MSPDVTGQAGRAESSPTRAQAPGPTHEVTDEEHAAQSLSRSVRQTNNCLDYLYLWRSKQSMGKYTRKQTRENPLVALNQKQNQKADRTQRMVGSKLTSSQTSRN